MDMEAESLPPAFTSMEKNAPAVLIAEDEVLIRFAITDYLVDWGLTVYEAGSAREAIKLLESAPEIAVVFADVRMPGDLDGLGLVKWIRTNRPGLNVILTSGDIRESDLSGKAGEPFIEKPYDFQTVAAHIKALVRAKA